MDVLEANQYEIERGKPIPSKNHNRLQARLIVLLTMLYDNIYDILSEPDLDLSRGWTVPDVVIFPKLQYDWIHDETKMTKVPITTIEILSPKQALVDLIIKAKEKYLKAGVKSSWVIVPPFKQVTIFYPNDTYETFNEGVIKDSSTGVEIEMDQLFR